MGMYMPGHGNALRDKFISAAPGWAPQYLVYDEGTLPLKGDLFDVKIPNIYY